MPVNTTHEHPAGCRENRKSSKIEEKEAEGRRQTVIVSHCYLWIELDWRQIQLSGNPPRGRELANKKFTRFRFPAATRQKCTYDNQAIYQRSGLRLGATQRSASGQRSGILVSQRFGSGRRAKINLRLNTGFGVDSMLLQIVGSSRSSHR